MEQNNWIAEEFILLNLVLESMNGSGHQFPLTNQPKLRQSSVAMIFRINPELQNLVKLKSKPTLNIPKEENGFIKTIFNCYDRIVDQKPVDIFHCLEVFFIKRAENDRDRHSGDVAFPGGKCDGKETDYEAAVRETFEECGFSLNDKEKYVHLGRFPKNFFLYKTAKKDHLFLQTHMFFQYTVEHLPMTLNESEASAGFWVPLRYLLTYNESAIRERTPITVVDRYKPHNKILAYIYSIFSKDVSGVIFKEVMLPSGYAVWGVTLAMLGYFSGEAERAIQKGHLHTIDSKQIRANYSVNNHRLLFKEEPSQLKRKILSEIISHTLNREQYMNDTRKISKKGWGFLFVVLAIMYARSFKPKL